MVFLVVMYGCERWVIKKVECQRTDVFVLWFWRRLLRVPWTARRSIQSILREISPEYSLQGLMLKLKPSILATWCKELTHLKRPCCWKDWRQEKKGMTEDEMVGWHYRFSGQWVWANSGRWWRTGNLACCSHGVFKSWMDATEWLNNHISVM